MSIEDDFVKLRGRIAALEVAFVTQTLVDELSVAGANPVEFAAGEPAFGNTSEKRLATTDQPVEQHFTTRL
jgi:hypothetical protein